MRSFDRESAIRKEMYGPTFHRPTYENLLTLYKETLQCIPNIQQVDKVAIIGAGVFEYFDVLALLSTLPNHHVTLDVSDIDPDFVKGSKEEWDNFLRGARRGLRNNLSQSTVQFRVADATNQAQFPLLYDLVIARNPGGYDPRTKSDVNKEQLFATAIALLKPKGHALVTTLNENEIEEHRGLMNQLPVTTLLNTQREPTFFYDSPGDIHTLLVQKN